jgi:hypothetical protein
MIMNAAVRTGFIETDKDGKRRHRQGRRDDQSDAKQHLDNLSEVFDEVGTAKNAALVQGQNH